MNAWTNPMQGERESCGFTGRLLTYQECQARVPVYVVNIFKKCILKLVEAGIF